MTEIPGPKKNLSVFSLIRTKKECYFPPVQADFTPLRSLNHTEQPILPHFNLDGNYFTQAFVNPYQNARLKENSLETLDKEREKFLKRVQSLDPCSTIQRSPISIQGPVFNPRDDNYCELCSASFKSYWAHVNSKQHIKHIKTNKFNSYIHELEANYNISGRTCSEEPSLNSLAMMKKKKISKRATKSKSTKSRQVFTREDFIIRLPSDLFEKEANHINYNISTNGLNSMESTLLKI